MDPLSILASVISISAAVSAVLERLRALHSADRELQAIVNEVSDIRVVFSVIQESWLRQRDRVKGLLEDLRSTRMNISAIWGASNM